MHALHNVDIYKNRWKKYKKQVIIKFFKIKFAHGSKYTYIYLTSGWANLMNSARSATRQSSSERSSKTLATILRLVAGYEVASWTRLSQFRRQSFSSSPNPSGLLNSLIPKRPVGNNAGSDLDAPRRDNLIPLFLVLNALPSGLKNDDTERLTRERVVGFLPHVRIRYIFYVIYSLFCQQEVDEMFLPVVSI